MITRRSFFALAPVGMLLPLVAQDETPADPPRADPTEPTRLYVDGLDPRNPRHQEAFARVLDELRLRGRI